MSLTFEALRKANLARIPLYLTDTELVHFAAAPPG